MLKRVPCLSEMVPRYNFHCYAGVLFDLQKKLDQNLRGNIFGQRKVFGSQPSPFHRYKEAEH